MIGPKAELSLKASGRRPRPNSYLSWTGPREMPSQALVGCEGAQVERERGLFERAQRASSGPSARKTSQWLVFSEVGKALAFPRTIPVLLRRSDERLARAGEERAAGRPGGSSSFERTN